MPRPGGGASFSSSLANSLRLRQKPSKRTSADLDVTSTRPPEDQPSQSCNGSPRVPPREFRPDAPADAARQRLLEHDQNRLIYAPNLPSRGVSKKPIIVVIRAIFARIFGLDMRRRSSPVRHSICMSLPWQWLITSSLMVTALFAAASSSASVRHPGRVGRGRRAVIEPAWAGRWS
jgi:hypothetical protein